jgi:hypothetical protein
VAGGCFSFSLILVCARWARHRIGRLWPMRCGMSRGVRTESRKLPGRWTLPSTARHVEVGTVQHPVAGHY